MAKELSKTSIFEYSDYRVFLKDWFSEEKKEREAVSFRFFSRAAGFSSPNFLKLVMDGKRNLSTLSIEKFSRALKLTKEEADFFRTLVSLNQSRSPEERRSHAEQLLKSRPYQKLHPLKSAQFAYYSSWYVVAIRELVDTKNFNEDPHWIASRLKPSITVTEAKRALEILFSLGLIRRNPEGRIVQSDSLLTTEDEVASVSVADFHREMIRRAGESIERFAPQNREISAATM
ncbi:MAG: TIGR02147 family protein, partial [Bdellovibrionota bacterium]